MVEQGADLIDVGGESSRPGAEPVVAGEELARVIPVIEELVRSAAVPISIDTTKAAVAEAALQAGAGLINDISALGHDPKLAGVAARYAAPVVLMHMRGEPRTMQQGPIVYDDVVGEILGFLQKAVERAEEAGIPRERVLVDPGIGFGKTAEHNLAILGGLERLRALGRPVLVGPSRKAFIGAVLKMQVEDRLMGTAAAVAAAVLNGADLVRVHDVGPMRQVADLAFAIRRGRLAA
jgi:dihydropteroate synthase